MTTEEKVQPKFSIETLDDFKRLLTIARGGDPDAIQAIADFMNLKSNIERSYFPDKKTTLCIAQQSGFGRLYFPDDDNDPFTLIADSISIAYMPYKGFKSNQMMEMLRQSPNLDALKSAPEEVKQGVLSRILGSGPKE